MRILQKMIGLFRRPMAEWGARQKSIEDLAHELEASAATMDERMRGRPDSNTNREAIAHWIGIERWGQRRLHVALGATLIMDEYHGYRPDKEQGIEGLREEFAETRAETVQLARRLDEKGVDPNTTIRHNDLGDLSVRGWLSYLIQHPEQESRARLIGRTSDDAQDAGQKHAGSTQS